MKSVERASGILLHPTSLPSRFGIGDLGPSAFRFIDFLKNSNQKYWQVLPLGPTGFGDSPYQSLSAYAGNPLLISPEILLKEGLLEQDRVEFSRASDHGAVDYGAAIDTKKTTLEEAFQNHIEGRVESGDAFRDFCSANAHWLEDYALFRAVKDANGSKPWFEWDEELKLRHRPALDEARGRLADEIAKEKFIQFLFFSQWSALKSHANGLGIRIIGDIPIFVAMDSADVWCNPSQFKLEADGSPRVVAGVPPDFFSASGQLWGNPIYDWNRMREDGFRWWVSRTRHMLGMFDVIRIDHFRGFAANYEIPGGAETAERGEWVSVPGRDLFATLKWVFGELPVIAEDLGFITGDVTRLREEFKIPGMRVLQFGFGGDSKSHDLPHNYTSDCVAYTGTHDNDTVNGWFHSKPEFVSDEHETSWEREREFCLRYLDSDGKEINWDFIRAVLSSVAGLAIVPLQDVLGCGSESRMNFPSTVSGNWGWRFSEENLDERLSVRLRDLTVLYGR